MRLIKLNFNN